MAFGNSGFLGQVATTVASTAAVMTEKAVKNGWEHNLARTHPLLAQIQSGVKNWNKGFREEGNAMIVPIIGQTSTNTYGSVARSAELTPMTANTTAGLTAARYLFAGHQGNIVWKPSELRLLKNGDRGNLIDAKVMQFEEEVRRVLSTELSGTANASDSVLLGLRYALSGASATALGEIDASDSGNAFWRAGYTASTGTLTEQTLRKAINVCHLNNGKPDLMLASNGGGATFDTYEKVMSFVAPQERIVNLNGAMAKYGFNSFMYRGVEVVQDYFLSIGGLNGCLLILDTDKFNWGGDVQPDEGKEQRISLTNGVEQAFIHYCVLGIRAPRANFQLAGITG